MASDDVNVKPHITKKASLNVKPYLRNGRDQNHLYILLYINEL
jgi:hypothetical protein